MSKPNVRHVETRRPRLRIVRLEERIAPLGCKLNPQGRPVGRCFRPG